MTKKPNKITQRNVVKIGKGKPAITITKRKVTRIIPKPTRKS